MDLSYLTVEAKQPFHDTGARLWEILRRALRWELIKRNLRSPYRLCPRWRPFHRRMCKSPPYQDQIALAAGSSSQRLMGNDLFKGKFQIILELSLEDNVRGVAGCREPCFCSCHLSPSGPLSMACHGLPKSTDFCPSSLQFTVLP